MRRCSELGFDLENGGGIDRAECFIAPRGDATRRCARLEDAANFCRRLYQKHTRSLEEELDTWSPARVRPSVALQMKTLNNLVAGCKSRREATLIDTYRCVPRRYTAWEHL